MANIKLGKLPARVDSRTLKLKSILRVLVPIPPTFDVDSRYSFLKDNSMFLNDQLGDCVIAARAHQTIRFEAFEQKSQILIPDSDVSAEYFKETGGGDTGLVMLDSLNLWRQQGWSIQGKNYKIHAFASVDWKNHNEVMAAIYLLQGVYFGMQVPQSAIDQFNAGQVWQVVSDDGGISGGHAVYALKYLQIVSVNQIGPTILTWGGYVQATWEFWDKYVDEAYVVIDERDSWIPSANDPLDIAAMEQYLAQVTGTQPPSSSLAITTTSLPAAKYHHQYKAQLEATGGVTPYSWAIVDSGKLPSGLTLSSAGLISGRPTVRRQIEVIRFKCTDSGGNTATRVLTMKVSRFCLL
jgi:hypothetical protein